MKKPLKTRVASPARSQARKKIFVVEDHPVSREDLVQVINREPELKVCGQAAAAEGALKEIIRQKPDLVLVDISLPGKSGLFLIKELRKVNRKVKLLGVSMHDEAIHANRVLRAGGDGYIVKQEDPEEVVDAIRDVLAGHIYVSEEVLSGKANPQKKSRKPVAGRPVDVLTDAQLEIHKLLDSGKDRAQIARSLESTPRAVDAQLAQVPEESNQTH